MYCIYTYIYRYTVKCMCEYVVHAFLYMVNATKGFVYAVSYERVKMLTTPATACIDAVAFLPKLCK